MWLLCAAAALRVPIFAAAFPFFSNLDEQAHFDLVVKMSHGDVPPQIVPLSVESARYIILYGSPEYLVPPERFPEGFPPPAWTMPPEKIREMTPVRVATINHESSSVPLYYAAAGAWMNVGSAS